MNHIVAFVEEHLKSHGSTADQATLTAVASAVVSEVVSELSAEVAAEVAAATISNMTPKT